MHWACCIPVWKRTPGAILLYCYPLSPLSHWGGLHWCSLNTLLLGFLSVSHERNCLLRILSCHRFGTSCIQLMLVHIVNIDSLISKPGTFVYWHNSQGKMLTNLFLGILWGTTASECEYWASSGMLYPYHVCIHGYEYISISKHVCEKHFQYIITVNFYLICYTL